MERGRRMSLDTIVAEIRDSKHRACLDAARRKADAMIDALHDLDGSRRGGGFNSAALGRARDYVEMAVAEMGE